MFNVLRLLMFGIHQNEFSRDILFLTVRCCRTFLIIIIDIVHINVCFSAFSTRAGFFTNRYWFLEYGKKVASLFRPGKLLYTRYRVYFTGRQIDHPYIGFGEIIPFFLFFSCFLEVSLRWFNRKSGIPTICTKSRRHTSWKTPLGTLHSIFKNDLAIRFLPHKSIGHPLTITAQHRVGNASPIGVSVMRDRFFLCLVPLYFLDHLWW